METESKWGMDAWVINPVSYKGYRAAACKSSPQMRVQIFLELPEVEKMISFPQVSRDA